MRVGIPTEIKNNEFRVAITPAGVHSLASHGHEVLVQAGAGLGSGSRTTSTKTPAQRSSTTSTRCGTTLSSS